MLLTEGARLGIPLPDEQKGNTFARQLLGEAKAEWHAFNLEATQKKADDAYQKGAKVRNEVRKKLRAD
jgi:hypothetical protein